jgi:hypothetical protein
MAYGANLTPDMATGIGSWTDDEIIRAIRTGKDDGDEQLCPTMPLYPDMADPEAKDVVAYLRSLPAVSRDIPGSQCDGKTEDDGGADAGDDASHDASSDAGCAGFAAPAMQAGCYACGTRPCQPNGCYNGYYCIIATSKCTPPPAGCP